MRRLFESFDVDCNGKIDANELGTAMTRLNIAYTPDKLAALIAEADDDGSKTIDFAEFSRVVERMKIAGGAGGAGQFEQVVTKHNAQVMQQKNGATVHSFAQEECAALCDFINSKLSYDAALSYLLPMREVTDLFSACVDGVLLCRLVNVAAPETVDERVINLKPPNRFLITENLNLALNAAKSLGIKVVNIGANDIIEARPHLVLGLVWQLVKVALLSKINLKENPNLIRLLMPDETLEALRKLPPEKLLLRWFNFHLQEAGVERRVHNWGNDLADSELYTHLLTRIDPERKANAEVLRQTADKMERAKAVVGHAQRLGAEFNVQPSDIVKGNDKLNLGLVAALFNACPGLEPLKVEEEAKLLDELPEEDEGDSREERALRMWVNSLNLESANGLDAVQVSNLFDDVRDGLLLLQTMEGVRPQLVQWARVNKPPIKNTFKKIENCNYAVELGRGPFGFSLVGVAGKDLADGNHKLTLALVWQLMRCHLTAFLATLRRQGSGSDDEMLKWANAQVAASGSAQSMRDFSDKSLASGLFLIDLLASIEPRSVNRALVTPGATEEEKALNAKYAISSARKLGCSLFCSWEDIIEAKPKMVMTFVATLMSFSLAAKPPTPRAAEAIS